MKRIVLIFLIFAISFSKEKNDTLFSLIKTKDIIEMTDGEYRYFKEYIDKNDIEIHCNDQKLENIKSKKIAEMNDNEFEFYDDYIFYCDANPCSLMQYLAIKERNDIYLTNNELDFRNNCKDECQNFVEKHPQTKAGKRKLRRKKIVRFSLIPIGLLGCAIGAFAYQPGGNR